MLHLLLFHYNSDANRSCGPQNAQKPAKSGSCLTLGDKTEVWVWKWMFPYRYHWPLCFMFTFLTPSTLLVLKESSCKVIKERQLKATASGFSEQLLYITLQEPGAMTKPQFSCWTLFSNRRVYWHYSLGKVEFSMSVCSGDMWCVQEST